MMTLLLLVQAATPSAPAPPQRFSILQQPCASSDSEVVVCARKPERLPLPEERSPPDGPRRPSGDPMAGLQHSGDAICASRARGCTVGVDMIGAGVAAVRLVGKLIDPNSCCDEPGQATDPVALVKDLAGTFRKKPDKSKRVAIALDAAPPPIAGRLLP